MARGGSRKHPADCKCGNCPKMGRPKQERPVDGNVARKIKAEIKAEKLWVALVDLERRRLGINKDGTLSESEKKAIDGPDYRGNFSIIPLTNLLRYLDDRDLGRCLENVNHIHDKPIEHTVTVSYFEAIERARKRATQK
jgi:hypothetical protein